MYQRSEDFAKFDSEVLFFVFYFQSGSREQIKAAMELKRRGWIFSKKYKTWFKKREEQKKRPQHQEPKKDIGTYIYFDDTDWCKRIKDNVEMDYSLVENELVVPAYEKED
jgi:CCR4-NOT transcription complex subunit 3